MVRVCRHNQPIAELRAVQPAPSRPARVAGLLKGLVHWEPGAFAPTSQGEVAEFAVASGGFDSGGAAEIGNRDAAFNGDSHTSFESIPGSLVKTGLNPVS